MKPTASRTVSRTMPINAKNAALLRLMVVDYTPTGAGKHIEQAHTTEASGPLRRGRDAAENTPQRRTGAAQRSRGGRDRPLASLMRAAACRAQQRPRSI
jgi:hypothetical protein